MPERLRASDTPIEPLSERVYPPWTEVVNHSGTMVTSAVRNELYVSWRSPVNLFFALA